MAICLRKPFFIKANVVSKAFISLYSYMAPSRMICSSERLKYNSSETNLPKKSRQLEIPGTHSCYSSWFPLHLYIIPSNLLQNHSEIIFGTGNPYDHKLKGAQHHNRLLLISLLAILGVKAFNSIPVLLADEINSEHSSTEPNWNFDEELNEDEACNESGEQVFLDSLENDGTFSQVFPEDLLITDPIEISDVQSLKHSHVVQEAAGVSAESALMLVIRASRALLAAMEDYRASLVHLLDLLGYNAVLINKLGQGAVYEEVLQQITRAMVKAKAHAENSKNRVTDLQLLVRVSAQAVESLNLCCLLSGAEATALASSAAVASLRTQVEAAELELRHLQADVLARQAEIIVLEDNRQPQEDLEQRDEEGPEGERKEHVVENELGVKESKEDSEF